MRNSPDRLIRLRKPIVDTACSIPGLSVPVVDVDHEAVGAHGGRPFPGTWLPEFWLFRHPRGGLLANAGRELLHRLAEEGHTASICYGDYIRQVPTIKSWKSLERETRRWLQELPKPAAIFACNDIPARTLADTCLILGFKVPGDVALLGVDNDDLECSLTVPPLSSIEIPGERIGYEAAETLDQMLNGGERPESVFLPPVGLVTRQSTDMTAVSDQAVSAALSFMREHATEGINVESVLLHVGITRRDLERRFRKLLHSSILQELRRIRVEHAKRLLAGTGLPMPAVARHSGFSSPQRLAVVFGNSNGSHPPNTGDRSAASAVSRLRFGCHWLLARQCLRLMIRSTPISSLDKAPATCPRITHSSNVVGVKLLRGRVKLRLRCWSRAARSFLRLLRARTQAWKQGEHQDGQRQTQITHDHSFQPNAMSR